MRKATYILITQAICVALSMVLSLLTLRANNMLTFVELMNWALLFYIFLGAISIVVFSTKYFDGRLQILMSFIATMLSTGMSLGFVIYAFSYSKFDVSRIDWIEALYRVVHFDITYIGLAFLTMVAFVIIYCTFLDRRFILFFRGGIFGKGKLKQINANLENSHWLTKKESENVFKHYKYSELGNVKKDGVPVIAKFNEKTKDLEIAFTGPCHSLIIGSTGSGKTTTFVNPMIQNLATTKAGSSMVISDPKGELFLLHSKYLESRGYDVKVVDLRDAYSSYRWNPLDSIWDMYQSYIDAENNVYERTDAFSGSGLKSSQDEELFDGIDTWYEFDGKAYASYEKLVEGVKVYKNRIFDEIYEDLNDLVSVLIPIENPRDPMWEKGARSIVLAVLLAMLEDSENEELKMTKEKFNFFNMTKILQASNNDYYDLRNYFGGRNVLSKAYSLSKQVCDCAEQTRASYMSIVYEKLTMFNDAGICSLTSTSDFSGADLSDKPTALFLKIPDEKDTRHNLASIFILDIYKTLIKVASNNEDLSLPRNVYFILDEFGNLPKIEKFDKMITVGRSRKIWFNMVVQSYAQLNNVYGNEVADIIKSNCAVKMFIGSNDINTCKEYSELCGNITVVTQSSSTVIEGNNTNLSNQIQTRPLIYPSELQRLNKPGDIGHAIIVTFGNYPLKSYFTPSFKVPLYVTGKMDTSRLSENLFEEDKVFYDVSKRNEIISNEEENGSNLVACESLEQDNMQSEKQESDIENLIKLYDKYKSENPNASLEDFLNQARLIEGGGTMKNDKKNF